MLITPPLTARTVFLTRHPETNSRVVDGIETRVRWTELEVLHFTYSVTGDIGRLRIPPPREPRQADQLWQHICFEAFVSMKGDTAYREFNFSPSGEWAVYSFRHYRERALLASEEVAPAITVDKGDDSLEIDAVVRLSHQAPLGLDTRFRLGLSAVIEEMDGRFSYWALKHPPGKPDFHHPDGFVLEIEPPALKVAGESFRSKR